MKTNLLHILFPICLITTVSSLSGQDVDHIYLKTGSVVKGRILEIQPDQHVKIEDGCGNVWSYTMDEVDRITSEPFPAGGEKGKTFPFHSGFVNMTSLGFLVGSHTNAQVAPFSLLMVNGWRNSFGLFTGAGAGVEFLSTNYMPLFLDVRYDLVKNDVVPYLMAKAGYSVPLSSAYSEYDVEYEYSGGKLAGFGAGLKFRTREHFAWDISLLYRYQKTSYLERYGWNEQENKYSDVYNRIEIRLGFYMD